MNIPKITELVTYVGKAVKGADWNSNLQKIVNWLSLGKTDIKVNSLDAKQITYNGNPIINNGNINTQSVTANTITSNNFVGNGENLTNIKVADVFAYTPFTVNSAKENFIDITDTSKLVFLVDDGTLYKPLLVTNAKGKQIKINSINDFDVTGLNGTYYIFVDEQTNGGSVYLKDCELYRQQDTPTGNNGDIWLDTSNQPFICREKVSNNWYTDEYNKVPVAKVVVTGGAITSLEYLSFNANGVTVNYNGKYSNPMQRPVVIVDFELDEVTGNWHKVYSNGWCEQGGKKTFNDTEYSTNFDVTFDKEMKNNSYSAYFTCGRESTSGAVNFGGGVRQKATTGMNIQILRVGSDDRCKFVDWKIEGFIK
ncbi:MAG: hypothetical protein II417_00775 [Elusimicrobia bacterium]|nr:hypothetical protein [Elusimicrobiota bacterium]